MSTKNKIEIGLEVKKPVRSISGVTPLTVVLAPKKCAHGTCIYCPGGDNVPQSYTDKSPAIMRAMKLKYDPYEQVKVRLNVLKLMKHPTDKIEIIILGGTFLQYPKNYKYNFIKKIYDALNNKNSKNLEEAKKINETAEHRCVAMCIENRPDNCSEKDIKEMLEFGATRVEIGVQMPDDELYKKTNRGHSVQDVIEATERLKNAGFKLGYHIMPGLPGSNIKKDLKLFKKIFQDEKFRPDQLKIYPCQVIQDSPLAKIHKLIKYKPYTTEQTEKFLMSAFKIIPRYCRIMRIMREIPKEKMASEIIKLDIRKSVEDKLRNERFKIQNNQKTRNFLMNSSTRNCQIQEIRMREIGFNKKDLNLNTKLKITKYSASNGDEYFLEFINKENILFGLLRLRISNKIAIIRELHIYGQALNLGKEGTESQHIGLGKKLMQKAEEIAKEDGFKKLKIISGIGVREYYKKLGYKLDKEGNYMVKRL